ncbi:hypothetical protein PV08_03458 [Exophiala spinifera]|uniref:Essential protein Yae1 N-terminal domain-containing protein n=1 Tax=Exophiala spinifera TaxID=91928 RepID=A0A0D2BKP8_9EURO|nr:uncharacterized protein PV08_03458 [Exophiala spinifera]KIW19165.1 hypothetical protein PV08_03458 [Exophiala spinifera]
MAFDPFDEILELENDYYREGYDAGVADSRYAGMIEGKVFGIEKGYEKAIELGKLHGRALVWQSRFLQQESIHPNPQQEPLKAPRPRSAQKLDESVMALRQLSTTTRLRRHVDGLQSVTDGRTLARDNSDEAVTEFDDRITRASAKAKVIANTVGESLNPATSTRTGIEDATGLQARH